VASVAGLRGLPYQAAYGSSKAALVHLTRSLAVEYATRGVRFNAVCPGTVLTPLVQKVAATMPRDLEPALLGRMQGAMPGIIDAREIAAAIL
jgi:meso-butanediol dehydrogenase/(S,S)-butanediol dehydrogenase/diacetyl reductase